MHYWYDERSAGGLKQKEENPLLPRIRKELLRRAFISIEIPYMYHARSTLYTDDRTRTLRSRLIRTRECAFTNGKKSAFTERCARARHLKDKLNKMIERE